MISVYTNKIELQKQFLETKKSLADISGNINLLSNAVVNLNSVVSGMMNKITELNNAEKEYKVTIKMGDAVVCEECACEEEKEKMIVVISSDRMGTGNDALGKVLIKGFIFAVSQLDKLPKTILFYNGGATLTAEGSDSLADLKNMEEQGVEIMTCGTCLDYYGLKEKLAVGTVTNMYSIVEKLAGADKIIQP